ncbi:hypothetical protein FACS1894158_02570 [Betaproteobacteria bacterium]|nr:hypothetical protein FACS1894158_02570 [Betaproteobacteria bacterium]
MSICNYWSEIRASITLMPELLPKKSSIFAYAALVSQNAPYVLIEGLPGGGKSTAIASVINKIDGFVMLEDICNPCLYAQNYRMDWAWVVLAESMKSQLAKRAEGIGLMERGYLSLLAFHAAEDILMGTSRCQDVAISLLASQSAGFFIPPTATIVLDLNPETSVERQNRTRMSEWRDSKRLTLIRKFYKSYVEHPLFNEQYSFIDAMGKPSKTLQCIMEILNVIKNN